MPTERRDSAPPGDLEEQLHALEDAREELAVANEELRVQQDELLAQQQQLQQQNAALQAERQRYRELFELAPDAYLVTDMQGLIQEANRAACTLLGVPAEYLIDKPLPVFLPGWDEDGLWQHLGDLREEKVAEVRNWETTLAPRRGTPVDVLVTIVPARSPQGDVTGLRWLLRDVTERKAWEQERERLLAEQVQAEKALRVSMEKYEVLVDAFPLGITVTDEQGQIVEANVASERLLGISQEEHRRRQAGGPEWQIVRLDGSPMPPEEYASIRALREGHLVEDVEMGIVRPDGETTWISVTAAPVPVEGYGVAVAYGDISARVRAEEVLRRYAGRLQLQHQTDQAILSARTADEMVEAVLRRLPHLLPCQRAGVNLLDPEAEEVWLLATYSAGETSLAKGWRAPVAESLGEAMDQLARGERFLVDDMQALEPWSPLAAQLQAEGVRAEILQPLIVRGELIGALGIGMNVPGPLPEEQLEAVGELADALAVGIQQMRLYEQVQRHAAELEQRVRLRTAELAASEARFRAVYEQAAIGIALLDRTGRVLSSNPALQRMLGYSARELQGLPLSTLGDGQEPLPPSPQAVAAEALSTPGPTDRTGGPIDRTGGPIDRTGGFQTRPYDADVLPSPPLGVDPEALPAPGQRDARQGGIEGGQPPTRTQQRYRRKDGETIETNVTASTIRLEDEQAHLALIEDVTEIRRAQEALRQSERLALTGRLAASVAHEIGNPLQAVIGCLSLAEEARAEGEDTAQYMELAMDELDRAARLVSRMRDLNRPSEEQREPVDVNALVDKILLLSQKQCQTHHVEVQRETGAGLPAIAAVPDRLQQVFLNLVLNAVDAMPEGGELGVRTAATDGPAGVTVTFADTGQGIPQEQLERLFEPFTSTKSQGLGLGLYVSHNIIDEHGGRIDVDSHPGHGTTLTIWLPAG